jgi:hypothetical protein
MGAPSSSLIAEIFLQHTEHQHMAQLSTEHKIINYFRYVDNILIILHSNHSSIQAILADFNTLHPNLQFTAEAKKGNTINYLDQVSTEPHLAGKLQFTGSPHSQTP